MKINNLGKLTKKLAAIAGIMGMSTLTGIPAIAQVQPTTPGTNQYPATGETPGAVTQDGQPTATPNTASNNLIAVAQSSDSFSTLTQAVEAAGLADTLSGGEYTIFAPTDQAFSTSLPPGAVEFLLQPENRDLLRQVLTYHVVPQQVTASQLETGTVNAVGGGLAVRVTPERVIVNNASVVQPDIEASNGVIHAVNRVLLPSQLRETIASRLEQQAPQTPEQ